MKSKLLLCLALVLSCIGVMICVAGCSSVTTGRVECTSLSDKEQGLVHSDLNHLLVSHGFTAWSHEEFPYAVGFWYAPLRKGNADFTVSAYTNSNGMVIYVHNYGLGRGSANKPLTGQLLRVLKATPPMCKLMST